MNIFKSLASGFCRTLKAWKGILIIWLGSLLTAALVALPARAFLKSGFGGSMITERLRDSLDIEVFGDLGEAFRGMMSSVSSGVFLLILVAMVLNAFLTGGIFDALRGSSGKFSARNFFKASAANFWPFLVITSIMTVIFVFLFLLVFILPVSYTSESDAASETAIFNTALISGILFFLVSRIFVMAADYARAWQAARAKTDCFGAIGFGFSRSFRIFFVSYPVVLIIALIQMSFAWLVFSFIGSWKPDTGGTVFLLFIISQLLFCIRTGIKVWRYGSITTLMEMKEEKAGAQMKTETQNIQS